MQHIIELFNKDKKRYLTAIVLLIALGVLLWINNIFLMWVVLGALFVIGFKESLVLYGIKEDTKLYILVAIIWILAFLNHRPIEVGIVACAGLAGFLAYKQTLSKKIFLPFLYPTIPFLALYSVYIDFNVYGIMWLILVVATSDIGAYFGGKIFGKTPLSLTSPKKTTEGAIIGLALAIIAGSIVGVWALSGVNFIQSVILSACVGAAGIFGDLYESYLKRQAGLKDSGNIFPGHGGVLDRLDAILFGAMAMHFLLYFLEIYKQKSSNLIPSVALDTLDLLIVLA